MPKEPTSLEEVQAIASSFAASVEGHAVAYAVLLNKYTILDLPNPPNYIDLQNQMEVLAFCAGQRSAIWTALNNVDYIIANSGQFESNPGEDLIAPLGAYRTALELDLKAVTTAASQALDHPKSATLPILTAIPPKFPKRLAGEADDLAAIGEAVTNADPLAAALRDNETQGERRRGFHVGMATEAKNTLWGPGAQSVKESLGTAAQQGFSIAAAYCLQRNNNADIARRGLAVVTADPAAQSARKLLPIGLSWLGFNIASGIFGNPALGALGNTAMGPGSQKIRASLDADAQRGFDAAVAVYVTK